MSRPKLLFLVAVLSLCLSGCQHWFSGTADKPSPAPVREVPAEDNSDEDAVADLVLYTQRAAQMNAEEQKREVGTWTQAMAREKGERATIARLRLALLFMLPGSGIQDDARAQSLLEPYANAGVNSSLLRQFGALLYGQIAERLKAHRRAEQLKEQLDALRAVERSLIERGQRPPMRKP